MLFSARAEYACLAMLELAAQYGDPRPVRLTEIANKHGISSPRFLVQILIQLNKAGLVTSTRGAAGGYHLARKPSEITLADVVSAVEGSETAGTRTKPRKPSSAELATMRAYSKCMRDHGVTAFPDPNPDGGMQLRAGKGTGIDPQSQTFKDADKACQKYQPDGGKGRPRLFSGGGK